MRGSAVETISYVGFRIGEVPLAVEARSVRGVTWNRDLIQVPFALRSVVGVMVRGGRVVPVFDLCRVAAAWNEMPPAGGEQVIVLGEGEVEAGLLASGAETFSAGSPRTLDTGWKPRSQGSLREAILSGALEVLGCTYRVLCIQAALEAAGVPKTFSGDAGETTR
jgi:chemotaxis signal transduction protein